MTQLLHYTACGLAHVWLANGEMVKSTPQGNAVPSKAGAACG